jgi:hypothetical protein
MNLMVDFVFSFCKRNADMELFTVKGQNRRGERLCDVYAERKNSRLNACEAKGLDSGGEKKVVPRLCPAQQWHHF